MRTRIATGACLALATLTVVVPADAHIGGKAVPRIAAAVSSETGLLRTLTVRVTDVDDGAPITDATVTAAAEMVMPRALRTAPSTLVETRTGVYRARVPFAMAGEWVVLIGVGGEDVVSAKSRLPVRVELTGVAAVRPSGRGVEVLSASLETQLTQRDVVSMIMLWIHGLAALGWIVGVVVMALALSTRPGVLAEGFRTKLRDEYVAWGAWVHWSLVLWIVLTGVYNMLVVTPFGLAWRPSAVGTLSEVPFGALYQAILIVKLLLFVALLVTGTQLLRRTVGMSGRARDAGQGDQQGFVRVTANALGLAGIAYLAIVPLILGAAVALRYVHILSHAGSGAPGA